MAEIKVGDVIKFFAKPSVAAIELIAGEVAVGDRLKFVGHTTDFEMSIESMQEDGAALEKAGIGQRIGIKVPDRVREGDQVYKVA